MEKLYINVWLGNLGKYNEGELIGDWYTLPTDLDKAFKEIGLNDQYEEYQINDYETNIEGLQVHHYANIYTLNAFAEWLDNLEEYEQLIVRAYCDQYGTSELLKNYESIEFDDYILYHDVNDMSDVAYRYYEETGALNELEKHININYVDFEAIGRDMNIEGTFVFLDNNICVQFLT